MQLTQEGKTSLPVRTHMLPPRYSRKLEIPSQGHDVQSGRKMKPCACHAFLSWRLITGLLGRSTLVRSLKLSPLASLYCWW